MITNSKLKGRLSSPGITLGAVLDTNPWCASLLLLPFVVLRYFYRPICQMITIFLRAIFPEHLQLPKRHGKLRRCDLLANDAARQARCSNTVPRAAFRISHMRASFTEGTINETYDSVKDLDPVSGIFCAPLFLEMGVGVATGARVACGSQFQGRFTGTWLTSCRTFARKHLKPGSNGRTRFISLDESCPIHFFSEGAFSCLNRKTTLAVSVAFRHGSWLEHVTLSESPQPRHLLSQACNVDSAIT